MNSNDNAIILSSTSNKLFISNELSIRVLSPL